MAIGILGGTFNPIHLGHLILAQEVANSLHLSKIIFIPAKIPPQKNITISPTHRYNMVNQAIQNNPLFELSDIEIRREGISYTIDTIQLLQKQQKSQLFFIIGADNITQLPTWHKWQKLIQICDIVIATRPGYNKNSILFLKDILDTELYNKISQNFIATPLIDISSTTIRKRCSQKDSIRYLVPDSVENYIREHNLYHAL